MTRRLKNEDGKWFTLFFTLRSPFSNFYQCKFEADNIDGERVVFNCVEQYYMYMKSAVFDDVDTAEQILRESNPKRMKQLGKNINNFQQSRWDKLSSEVMHKALTAKFSQNADLRCYLFKSHESTLVEASPMDRVWGIGMSMDNPDALYPKKWNGTNRLGEIMMKVRSALWNEQRFAREREIAAQEVARAPADVFRDLDWNPMPSSSPYVSSPAVSRKRPRDDRWNDSQQTPLQQRKRGRYDEENALLASLERVTRRDRYREKDDDDDEEEEDGLETIMRVRVVPTHTPSQPSPLAEEQPRRQHPRVIFGSQSDASSVSSIPIPPPPPAYPPSPPPPADATTTTGKRHFVREGEEQPITSISERHEPKKAKRMMDKQSVGPIRIHINPKLVAAQENPLIKKTREEAVAKRLSEIHTKAETAKSDEVVNGAEKKEAARKEEMDDDDEEALIDTIMKNMKDMEQRPPSASSKLADSRTSTRISHRRSSSSSSSEEERRRKRRSPIRKTRDGREEKRERRKSPSPIRRRKVEETNEKRGKTEDARMRLKRKRSPSASPPPSAKKSSKDEKNDDSRPSKYADVAKVKKEKKHKKEKKAKKAERSPSPVNHRKDKESKNVDKDGKDGASTALREKKAKEEEKTRKAAPTRVTPPPEEKKKEKKRVDELKKKEGEKTERKPIEPPSTKKEEKKKEERKPVEEKKREERKPTEEKKKEERKKIVPPVDERKEKKERRPIEAPATTSSTMRKPVEAPVPSEGRQRLQEAPKKMSEKRADILPPAVILKPVLASASKDSLKMGGTAGLADKERKKNQLQSRLLNMINKQLSQAHAEHL